MDNSVDFLYAEDDEDTVVLFNLLMKKVAPLVKYKIFDDGKQLIDYLHGEGAYHYPASPQPKFVLTDLACPAQMDTNC